MSARPGQSARWQDCNPRYRGFYNQCGKRIHSTDRQSIALSGKIELRFSGDKNTDQSFMRRIEKLGEAGTINIENIEKNVGENYQRANNIKRLAICREILVA